MLVAACAQPPTIPLELAIQPAAIAFRAAGDAGWSEVPELSQSERSAIYDVPDEDGTLAIACTWPDGSVQIEELLATAGEFGSAFYAPLEPWPQLGCGPADPPIVLVAGDMDQGGEIYIGSWEFEGGFDDWGYAGPVAEGIHDLVAISGNSVLIRHDQAMISTYVEPAIDISQGIDRETDYLGANGQAMGWITTELMTVNGTQLSLATGTTGQADVVPDSQLEPGDTQVVYASLGNDSEAYVLPPVSLESLDGLVGPTVNETIQFDPASLAADLSPLSLDSAVSQVRLEYYDFADPELELAATATPRWLALHGPQLAFDTSFPDFRWSLGESPSPRLYAIDRVSTAMLATYLGQ